MNRTIVTLIVFLAFLTGATVLLGTRVQARPPSPTVERPFCNPTFTHPSVSVLVPGALYTAACSNVDIALIDVEVLSGPADDFQIVTVDTSSACGDQDFAMPPTTPAGTYRLSPVVYPCDECPEERKAAKTYTVE